MLFLVNIFTEINHRKKSSTKTCFYLIVFKKFSLSGATPRDTNSSTNNQFKINQFIIWMVKKGKKLMKLGTKVVQNLENLGRKVFTSFFSASCEKS